MIALRKTAGTTGGLLAEPLFNLGSIERTRGRYELALDHYREALEAAGGAGSASTGGRRRVLLAIGGVEQALGRSRNALATLDEALAIPAPPAETHEDQARARFEIARAAWNEGEVARARREASLALEILAASDVPLAVEIQRWVDKHGEQGAK